MSEEQINEFEMEYAERMKLRDTFQVLFDEIEISFEQFDGRLCVVLWHSDFELHRAEIAIGLEILGDGWPDQESRACMQQRKRMVKEFISLTEKAKRAEI